MSTLSGNATKGEKGKKFQQLKINLCTANKPTEPEQQQHKSSIQRKQHGMTSLGKVPTARRPTNLPSEKSEHSGNDPSINLVPSGGAGWGNKQNENGSTTPTLVQSTNAPPTVPTNNVPIAGTLQQVPHVQHYPPASRMPPMSQVGHVTVHHGHTDVKTWAMMTHGSDSSTPNFLAPQSPLFQHEFPSLSSNAETTSESTPVTATATQKPTASTTADTQYGPGPSLRPQTEGSWIQGGSRPQGSMVPAAGNLSATAPAQVRPMGPYPPHIGPDGVRNNLAPSGAGVVPGGPYPPVMPQQHMIPPQFSGMLPPFMLRNSYPGGFPQNFQGTMKGVGPRPPYPPYMPAGPHAQAERFMPPPGTGANSGKRPYDDEDVKIRPIIKEEDLNQMANIGNDIGWAGHEDIDYNQKLKFSDDEDDDKSKDNRGKVRGKSQLSKGGEKPTDMKESEKENDLRSSKESLKEREKLHSTDSRNTEVRNAWQIRRAVIPMPTPSASRYQIPANGRYEEDDEAWKEKVRQKKEEMEIIVQRAKERKEEEEKRFIEQQQAAALKLKKLEAEMFANQSGNKENKMLYSSDRDTDMLPEWEKEKLKAQNRSNNENLNGDDTRKTQNATPVPVVKDASEFRELTQLVDRSNFVKKDTKERENSQPGFSRTFTNNIPPRFQNLNRQNSGGFSSTSGPSRNIIPQQSQFSGKSNSNSSFGPTRHNRADMDSLPDKDRDWPQEESRKEREADRYSKESVHDREYGYDRDADRKYENKPAKEYDLKRKYYNEKDEYNGQSYNRDFERENSYNKTERKNSESEREKYHRYSESESPEKDSRWRMHDEAVERPRPYVASPRPQRLFSESENHERKKSREEVYENNKSYNADREREYYRKPESVSREKIDSDHDTEKERTNFIGDHKKEPENDPKRERDYEAPREKDTYKEREKKSPSPYDDRHVRSELKESRFHRGSRETLREESYIIQEGRSYAWTDEADVEEKTKIRREHYREDRGDRYSHAQRHPPGPITRAKLEAKELESESKRSLTALVRSDKKTEIKKPEVDDSKDKENAEKPVSKTEIVQNSSNSLKSDHQNDIQSVWKKDDKKEKEDTKSSQSSHAQNEQTAERNESAKEKDDKKDSSKTASKQDSDVSGLDKRNDRRKSDRRNKSDLRNWTRYSVYHGSSYSSSSRSEPKLRRSNRGASVKSSSRRDSKYSEDEYSDEMAGSGRDDRSTRNEREKPRPVKSSSSSSKRYDRDDRGRDYRMDDRDYAGTRGRNSRDSYYYKPPQRGRGGFRSSVAGGASKRVDSYGPPSSKNQFGGSSSSYLEDKRHKSTNKESTPLVADQNTVDSNKKIESENAVAGKGNSRSTVIDRSWKKNYENAQENKSTVSSPTSTQAEANEESFATASEGTDSEDNEQSSKNKSGYVGTKRATTVVATKPQRRNFRSTSRKRYDSRRTGGVYTRKDSVTYSGSKRPVTSSTSKPSGKENEKANNETAVELSSVNKDESKSGDKPQKDYSDGQIKKNVKPRNRSNSRKNVRPSSGAVASRPKNPQDMPPRLQQKPKSSSGKVSGDYKDSKSSEISMPYFREVGPPIPAPPPAGNAWDKPLTGTLRNGSPATQRPAAIGSSAASVSSTNTTTTVIVQEKSIVQITEQHTESSPLSTEVSSSSTLSAEKVTTKVLENLDGATPPVQTIIFENTNFKSAPSDLSSKSKYANQLKSHRFEKDSKLDNLDSNVANFGSESSNAELPNKHDPLQMALSFNKNEDVADMKLDFTFDSEFSKLTEDKSAKTIELTHAMHLVQASTDADLNFKIASVKKVWDGSLGEHFDDKYDGGMVNTSTSFSPSFSHGSDPNNGSCYGNSLVENSGHVQVDDVSLGHNDIVFSPVSQIQAVNSSYGSSSNCQTVVIKNDSTSSSSNVCKVKPQPQGASMANVAQSSVISTTLVSQPPPMSSPSYNSFSCSTPQPNINNNAVAATALAQINFQPYNSMPPVPSSPVLFSSSQTPAPTAGLYQAFQIDNSQVAARSPFGQYSSYLPGALSQTSAFNQQSVFVQPPPNAPPPDLYPAQVPPYRLQAQYGNTQQITSQNTVLISSSSNSLMSATIKPSSQQINAIGTKTGYQAAQTSTQYYIPLDPASQLLNQNLLPSGQLLQRPASNVVPAPSLQASTSFYSSQSAPGQTAFFQSGTNSGLQPQAGTIGLTAFNPQSATPSLQHAGIQGFNSQLPQQYRSAPASYLTKTGNASSITSDFGGNKGFNPNQHDVMNPGFPPSTQMAPNKQRIQMGGKNVPTVQQAMQHSMPQNAYSYQAPNQMRNNGGASKGSQYPHPIQRPVSQGNNSNRGGNNASNTSASHRMPVRNNSHQLVNSIQQPPSSVYYSTSSGYNASKLESSQLESKSDSNADSKLADSIKTINAKNTSPATEKNASSNE